MGRGRKPRILEPDPIEAIQPEALADLLTALSDEERERVRQALLDRATGHKVWAGLRKINVPSGAQKYEVVKSLEANEIGVDPGWIYIVPPDPTALKLLVDHNQGRAPIRQNEKFDPDITIIHHVPGKRNWERAGDGAITCNKADAATTEGPTETLVDEDELLAVEPAEAPSGFEDAFTEIGEVGEEAWS